MKILFFVFHGFSVYSGVSKKILNQVKGLKDAGHTVNICHYDLLPNNHRCRMINDDVLEDYGTGFLASIRKRVCYGSVIEYIKAHHIQMIYIRSFNNADPFIIHFLNQLRLIGVKTVMEIPTYPYDQEYRGFSYKERLGLKVDQLFRYRLAKKLLRIVTFSDENVIFGSKTIKISNGIDFDSVPVKKTLRVKPSPFHLIGVAEVHYWHAFDRVINGLGEYYNAAHDREVYFHVVGGIGESEKRLFESIIAKYHIEKYMIFHGQLFGKELDDLFEQADFSIASLGRHRTGIDKIKTLKNREYAARGIPFIYSETDSDFDDRPYIMKATSDEAPIDIEKILDFYDGHLFSSREIRESIKYLNWENQMGKVVECVEKISI